MPTVVHVPELGEDLEFPDDASESDIASAIEDQISQKSSRSGPVLDRLPFMQGPEANTFQNLGGGTPVGNLLRASPLSLPQDSPMAMSAADLEQGQRRVGLDRLQRGQGAAVEEGGLGTQLGLGVPRGLAQLGEQGWGALSGAGSAAEFIPTGAVPGVDFLRTLRPFAESRRQVAAENVANLETIAGNTGGPQFAGDVVAGAISSAPSLAAAPVGGFIPAVVMAGIQSYGSGFSEAKQRGLDDFNAQQDGLVKGAITAGATFAFGKTGIESLATPTVRESFKKSLMEIFVKGGVAEGFEEMADTVTSTTYDYLRRDPNITFEDGLSRALKSLGIGAIVGSGVTAVAQAGAPTLAGDRQAQAIDMLPQGESALQGAPLTGDIPVGDRIKAIDDSLAEIEKELGPREVYDPATGKFDKSPYRILSAKEKELLDLRSELEKEWTGTPAAPTAPQVKAGDKIPRMTKDEEGFYDETISLENKEFIKKLPTFSQVVTRLGDIYQKDSDGNWYHMPEIQEPGNSSDKNRGSVKGFDGGTVRRVGKEGDPTESITAATILGRETGLTSPQEVQSMSNAEIDALVKSKDPTTGASFSFQREGIQWGSKQPASELPKLQALSQESQNKAVKAMQAKDFDTANTEMARAQFYASMAEGVTGANDLPGVRATYDSLVESGIVTPKTTAATPEGAGFKKVNIGGEVSHQLTVPGGQLLANFEGTGDIRMRLIGVDKDARNKGVGTKLVNSLKKIADAQGRAIVLVANPPSGESQETLNKFYEKQGFKRQGDDPNSKKPIFLYEPKPTTTGTPNETTQEKETPVLTPLSSTPNINDLRAQFRQQNKAEIDALGDDSTVEQRSELESKFRDFVASANKNSEASRKLIEKTNRDAFLKDPTGIVASLMKDESPFTLGERLLSRGVAEVKAVRKGRGTLSHKGTIAEGIISNFSITVKIGNRERIYNDIGSRNDRRSLEETKADAVGRFAKEIAEPDKPSEQPAGAIALPGPSLAPSATPVPSKTPKSQRQIIADLAKGLKLPIRFGRLRTTKFAGYFLKVADLIGSKRANDIPVVTHEVGHKLDTEFNLSSNPAIASELDVLGDPATPGSRSSWTASKPRTYKMGEGVAEFVRLWMTDPAKALADAPNTHAYFESVLDANKDFGDVMSQARDDIQVWRTAEPQARLRSHISVGSNPNKTRYTLSQLTRDVVDDLHILRLAVDDANKLGSEDLPPSQNPYLLARNLRGSYGMAGTFIQSGIVDFDSKEVQLGTSLEDALKPVAGRINDFRDWIVAKRAQELHKQGRNTGLVDSDVNTTAAKFNSDPAFQEAFTKIKAWNDAVLQYAVDSGLVTPDGAVNIRRMNQDYVPMHRVFEVGAGEPGSEGAGTGRGLNVGTPGALRGLKGSSRDIVDPLETMIRNAYAIITASEKSAINTAVANLSTRQGMGKWVERIATPKQQVKVGLEKIREQLENEGADLTAVPDDLLLAFFQNSGRAPFGENVIKIVRDGDPEFYRLNKDLFDTFHALDLEDSGKLIQIISSPAQLLRAGVTLTPDFALANAFRDTFGAAIISKYNALPFEVTLRGIAAMVSNPKLVAEWAAAGGKQSIEATYFDRTKLQSFLKERITKDLSPAERALIITKSPLTALRWFTGALEEATRIGEYSKGVKALTKAGMPDGEARRLSAFEARDRQDFAKGGAKTKIVRRMAAFWNAGLQANVRLAQAFKNRPVQTTLKGLAFVTLPKLLEQAVNWDDEDYWDRPQWERDLFFLIPIGEGKDGHTRFLRLPTPFEVGVIFGTFPGRILQWAKTNDSEAMKSFPSLFLRQSIPNPIPQALQTVFADFLSGKKGWDVWRGRTVVPEALADLPPEMQFTEQTSVTARNLGKLLGYSPMKIDHIIQGAAGGLGQQTVHQILDRAFEAMGSGERTAQGKVPGGRFVTTPATVSSESVDQFYKTLEELRTEVAGEKRGREPKMNTGWAPVFEANSRLIADLRRRGRETTDTAEKSEIRELVLGIARETMTLYREPESASAP